MRRREKFVITSIILSFGLLLVQFVALDYRYWAVAVLALVSYLVSGWALSDDLQPFEWLTIVPFPALYSASVGLFYFLLPESFWSRVGILGLFGVGMYALFLTSNIYSVAKGRTIQLLHAAHAVGLLFTLLTSLLFSNTIFSLRLPFYFNGLLIGLTHFPLIFMSFWSVNVHQRINREVVTFTGLLTLVLVEFSIIFSFYPLSVWNSALLIMAWMYIGLGVVHNLLRGVLFDNIIREYSLVAAFVGIIFILLIPFK